MGGWRGELDKSLQREGGKLFCAKEGGEKEGFGGREGVADKIAASLNMYTV